MNINYKIEKINYGITFCENKEAPDIVNNLKRNFFDRKLLLIMDQKLSKNFSKYLYKDLSKMNLEISVMKLDATKKIKTKKYYLELLIN